MIANIAVISILVIWGVLSIRYIYRDMKSGGCAGCTASSGCSGHCAGCHSHCSGAEEMKKVDEIRAGLKGDTLKKQG
ncbi:MAG: hypothetical protein K6F99_02480 [Lachnospiraceae bacterium]|nr:hypothetical protein [Lachnospiraceae bacterium]